METKLKDWRLHTKYELEILQLNTRINYTQP